MSDQLPPLAIKGPLVVRHAAFAVSPRIYDELARILRLRSYHHVFDPENGAIYMDQIALTRDVATLTAEDIKKATGPMQTFPGSRVTTSWLIENGKTGFERRYITLVDGVSNWTDDIVNAIQFAREKDANTFKGGAAGWFPIQHVWG